MTKKIKQTPLKIISSSTDISLMNRLLLIVTLLFSSTLYAKMSKSETEARSTANEIAFLNSRSLESQGKIKAMTLKMAKAEEGFHVLSESSHKEDDTQYIVIPGFGKLNETSWYSPAETILKSEKNVSFFRWSFDEGLDQNSKVLTEEVKKIKKNSPHKKIVLIGHSTGGLIATNALSNFIPKELQKDIFTHTLATPYGGYNVPSGAWLVKPFIGSMRVDVGLGAIKKIKGTLQNCHQWVTTNCELDIHACKHGSGYPQIIGKDNLNDLEKVRTVCGQKNVTLLDNDDHSSVIGTVFKEIFKEKKEEQKKECPPENLMPLPEVDLLKETIIHIEPHK